MRKTRPIDLTAAEKRFPMADWVSRNMVVGERSGPEWVVDCPLCGRSKLAIHVGRKAWQCFGCPYGFAGWRPVVLVAAVLKVSGIEAAELVAAVSSGVLLGPVAGLARPGELQRSQWEIPTAPLPPGLVDGLTPSQGDYLASRGIPPEHAVMLGLCAALGDGSGTKADQLFTGRVVWPIWGPRGDVIFWTARSTRPNDRAKFLNMPRACRQETHDPDCTCYHLEWGIDPVARCAAKGEVVLGLHLIQAGEPVGVLEGPTDLAVCGPGFCATMGASMSATQAMLIAGSGASEAVLLYDPDKAGEKGLERAASSLSPLMPVRVGVLPPKLDPADLGRDRMLEIRHDAPYHDEIAALDAGRPSGYGRSVRRAAPYISGLNKF